MANLHSNKLRLKLVPAVVGFLGLRNLHSNKLRLKRLKKSVSQHQFTTIYIPIS